MDNHADGSGIPFERPYFADSSMIREFTATLISYVRKSRER